MAVEQIIKVRTVRPPGHRFDHIEAVTLMGGAIRGRQQVVSDILSVWGNRYFTYASGARADVIVRRCSECSMPDYLTTAPDWTPANNLLMLPRF